MRDETHLHALELGLSHERARLAKAISESEKALRAVWVWQIEREIAAEIAFLGKTEVPEVDMTDEELLAELGL